MALPRPDPVAVRAHHIAFGCFMEDDGRRREQRASGSQPERFHRVIPMVEIHLVRFEFAAAIHARDISPFPQHFDGTDLAYFDPKQLLVAIASVVVDVVCPLISNTRHCAIIVHMF